jgi:hypothetical protein
MVTGGPDDAGVERMGVPLGFTVPDGWTSAEPASVGIPKAAFVAVRPAQPGEFTANISLAVQRRSDGPEIADLADEAVGRAAVAVAELQLLDRDAIGDPHAPGVTQVLEVRTHSRNGQPSRQLTQTQVHLAIPLSDTEADVLAVEMVCTCAPGQLSGVIPAFQRFVASFHLREKDGRSA